MAGMTEICNMALALIGQKPIQNVEDTTSVNAGYCRQFWDIARDGALEDFAWPFATRRVQLQDTDYTPSHEYAYAFALPADLIKVQALQDHRIVYTIEARDSGDLVLLTNEPEIYLKYTGRSEITGRWSPNFVEAMAAKLALYLCGPIVGKNTSKLELMSKFYEMALSKARHAAVTQGFEPRESESSWLTSRNL